jgi:hypothetical protein
VQELKVAGVSFPIMAASLSRSIENAFLRFFPRYLGKISPMLFARFVTPSAALDYRMAQAGRSIWLAPRLVLRGEFS